MRLLILAGLVRPAEIDEVVASDPKALSILNEVALILVKTGWTPTLPELEAFTATEKAAVSRARAALDAERAVRAGIAASGPAGLAVAAEDADGGEARATVAVGVGLEGALRRARGMEPERS